MKPPAGEHAPQAPELLTGSALAEPATPAGLFLTGSGRYPHQADA
jgi:hypothetical protein